MSLILEFEKGEKHEKTTYVLDCVTLFPPFPGKAPGEGLYRLMARFFRAIFIKADRTGISIKNGVTLHRQSRIKINYPYLDRSTPILSQY